MPTHTTRWVRSWGRWPADSGCCLCLSAPGAWQATVVLLVVLSVVALMIARRESEGFGSMVVPAGALLAALLMLTATGPTAAWRHGQIGAGRIGPGIDSRNAMVDWINLQRRRTIWERDGKLASVALVKENGLSFFVNGKSDGHTNADAGTQVMSALVGRDAARRSQGDHGDRPWDRLQRRVVGRSAIGSERRRHRDRAGDRGGGASMRRRSTTMSSITTK